MIKRWNSLDWRTKNEDSVLRNADLKLYADVAARSGQTRFYLDVLQQWAFRERGTLAAERRGVTSRSSFKSGLAMLILPLMPSNEQLMPIRMIG